MSLVSTFPTEKVNWWQISLDGWGNPLTSLTWFWFSTFYLIFTKHWPKLDSHHMVKVWTSLLQVSRNFISRSNSVSLLSSTLQPQLLQSLHLTCISNKRWRGRVWGKGIYVWISARALPSCSPPPPRYFSLLGTEGNFRGYSRKKKKGTLGIKAPAAL